MMPYCVGDPHSHCLAVQLRHPQFCGAERGTVVVSSARIDHAIPVWRWWRWRMVAVTTLMAICTLVMLLTMESAVLDARLPPSGRVDSSMLDQENSETMGDRESEFKGSDRLAASDGSAKGSRQPEADVLGNEKELHSVDQAKIKKRGLRNRKKLQSALIKRPKMINPPELATPPLSHMRRRPRVAGIDCLTFSNRRILADTICTNKDISIFQSPDGSSGIPRYAVQIMNNCMSDCPPSDIHVFCGWFASALLVNPNSFKRLTFNDCLVNGGKPLRHGETLRFTYANSFMYPIRFKSASFCK